MYVCVRECVCVFIKLDITAQSGSFVLVILCHCVCVLCVSVFIKLHITAQSGPVTLVIICHSHRSSQEGGINDSVCVCVCVCYVALLHTTWVSMVFSARRLYSGPRTTIAEQE